MSRRIPIYDEVVAALSPLGRHRPEVVVDRLVGEAISDLEQIRSLEHTVSDLPSVLSRLDAVVAAAAEVKATAEAAVVAEVEARVEQLESELGLTAPAPAGPGDGTDQPADAPQ